MKKTTLVILLLGAFGLATGYALKKYSQRGGPMFDSSLLGQSAPPFSLPAIAASTNNTSVNLNSNQVLNLKDYKDKLVLLNFWASWCPPCRDEIPDFIKTQHKFRGKPFTIIGIAIEDGDSVKRYSKVTGINYPVAYGVEQSHQVTTAYGNPDGALPYSVLISPEQKVLATYAGKLSEKKLLGIIEKHLK